MTWSVHEAGVAVRVSVAAFAATLVTFAIAVMTPPLSGPLCVAEKCFAYPYLDTAARFPRDFLWMYPAMAFATLFVAWIACIHHLAPARSRLFTLMGLCAGSAGAATLVLTYFVQLAVVQPSLLAGETDGIALISQFNAHGVFIALEEVGYLLMALSFAFAATAFDGFGRIERALRWTLAAGFLLAIAALAIVSFRYGIRREYRFEIAVITIDWIVLLAATAMTAALYRRVAAAKPTGNIITVQMVTDEKGNYFSPATIDAARGDVIRFTLKTGMPNVSFPHDSNSIKAGLPASSDYLQRPGQEYDLAVNMGPGSYYFHCDPHAALGMKGKLNVR